MTGIIRGPVGINSHVPVESTIDRLQESKLLGWVVSILRCPVEAIKMLAGILYSVEDRGVLAKKSFGNLIISIIGSCPVVGALGVTAFHQALVKSGRNKPGLIPPQNESDKQITTLEKFFTLNDSRPLSYRERIRAHLILEEMSPMTLIQLYERQKKRELIIRGTSKEPLYFDPIAPKIADFMLSRTVANPDNFTSEDLNIIVGFSALLELQKKELSLTNKFKQADKLHDIEKDREAEWSLTNETGAKMSVKELQEKLQEVKQRKPSVWRDELISHINEMIPSSDEE